MIRCLYFLVICCSMLATYSVPGAIAAEKEAEDFIPRLKATGHILLIRHAYAPGTGDPENFTIGKCETQRNLDDRGRAQARLIGEWLRGIGLNSARVYSSQWCRCLETAELLGIGAVKELPALNSFFEQPQDREPNLTALREFISRQPVDGRLIVFVTHYVTIAGIANEGVSSGEGVVLQLTGTGGYDVIGRLGFDFETKSGKMF